MSKLSRSKLNDNGWQEKFNQLCKFKKEHGHANVPTGYKENPSLSVWVMNQRQTYKKGLMKEERIEKLEKIEFQWKQRDRNAMAYYSWEKMFEAFNEFQEKYHHPLVPSSHVWKEDMQLGAWVISQRAFYRKNKLTPQKIEQLNKVNFAWDVEKWAWEQRYKELLAYKEEHSHCNVPFNEAGIVYENCNLLKQPFGEWVQIQRRGYLKGELKEYQRKKIEALEIDLDYNKRELAWDNMFDKLVAYGEKYGTVNFSILKKENPYYTLGFWSNNQRGRYNQGKLSKRRIQKLESIGFSWSLVSDDGKNELDYYSPWKKKYDALKKYIETNDDDVLCELRNSNRSLHKWLLMQATRYKKGELSDKKIEMFEDINIDLKDYALDNSKWVLTYKEMKKSLELAIEQEVGLSLIDYKSYCWVKKQQSDAKTEDMADWKKELIKNLPNEVIEIKKVNALWLNTYQHLCDYMNGGYSLKEIREKDYKMYAWVKKQGRKIQQNQLSKQQEMMLKKIGFDFN